MMVKCRGVDDDDDDDDDDRIFASGDVDWPWLCWRRCRDSLETLVELLGLVVDLDAVKNRLGLAVEGRVLLGGDETREAPAQGADADAFQLAGVG